VLEVSKTKAARTSFVPKRAHVFSNRPSFAPHRLRRRVHQSEPPPNLKTLLWIDDYAPGLSVYSAIFENLGFRVITASRPTLGLRLAASEPIDAVIVDYEMPEMNGAEVAAELKRRNPGLPVILFSGAISLPGRLAKVADALCDKAEPLERVMAAVNRLIGMKTALPPQTHSVRPSSDLSIRATA
jgi:DNA-binding NtrC family response regulator